ncbi:hypothetical protein PUR61_08920, partial [Streptomyces sp. BE20]|nr:hypothetical protein [Streptomyces sp. BE20]
MDQSGHHPVGEDELVTCTGTGGSLPRPASRVVAAPLDHGLPGLGQLGDQTAQMPPGDTGKQPMRQNRPIDHDPHAAIMPPAAQRPHSLSRTNS